MALEAIQNSYVNNEKILDVKQKMDNYWLLILT